MTPVLFHRTLALVGVLAASTITGADERPPGAPSSDRPHVVLVTVDSLRTDRLGCYTQGSRKTPAIDALAARGVRFERAYAASPSTAPSHATILTGLYPARHGLRSDLGGRVDGAVTTLAERLRAGGYATVAVLGSFRLDSDRGLERGFEAYDDDLPGLRKRLTTLSRERRAGEVVDRALSRLDAVRGERPAFLWLNFHDPHLDYDPPGEQKERYKDAPYDGEVAYVDARLQGLINGLRAKRRFERTLVILAGSHGEGLRDHGETGHGVYLYEPTIRVPLVIAGPGVASGRTIVTPASLADLTPTILDLAGLPVPSGLDGESQRARLTTEDETVAVAGKPAGERVLFSEAAQPHLAYGWAPLFAIVQGDRKIVHGRRTLSYDLRADPGEARPLAPVPDWASHLLESGRKILGSLDLAPDRRRSLDAAAAGLKPPWDNSPTCVEKESRPDPRDAVPSALQDRLFRARLEADQGAPGRAAELAGEILQHDPANFTALDLQLAFSMRGGGIAQMADRIELLQCNYPERGAGYHYLAHYYMVRNQPENAIASLRLLAMVEPWNEEADYDQATIYAGLGRKDDAIAHLRSSIRLGATDYDFIRNDPRLRALRADPRFQELLGPAGTDPGTSR